jgi:inositol-1,3,4-trisphosphate 5/6-kinase/inositol-tetrakisphosphate 1-kinase
VQSAALLREALGLSLFGFDVIQSASSGDLIVVDVNYFPSYKELDFFPEMLYRLILHRHRTQTRSVDLTSGEP